MTITLKHEEDDQRQMSVTVDIAEDRVEKGMKKVAKDLAKKMDVPGFRPGKAPFSVIAKRFGMESIRAEAIEKMMDEIFNEMLDELKIEPIAPAQLLDMSLEPASVQFLIPLKPIVRLGDYQGLRKEIPAVEIKEEAVDAALNHIRSHHAVVETVDRPLETGDLVAFSGTGVINEENGITLFDEERLELPLDAQEIVFGQLFIDQLVGASVGESKEFTLNFSDEIEDPSLQGKEVVFKLEILDVKSRELPPLDDELAKLDGQAETLEELRTKLETELRTHATNQYRDDLLGSFVDSLTEDMEELVYAPATVDIQVDNMVDKLKQTAEQQGWPLDDYLKLQLQLPSLDAYRESQRTEAESIVRRTLLLQEFIDSEKLEVTDAEFEEKVGSTLNDIEDPEMRDKVREMYLQYLRPQYYNEILMNKVIDRVELIYSGQYVAESETAEEAVVETVVETVETTDAPVESE